MKSATAALPDPCLLHAGEEERPQSAYRLLWLAVGLPQLSLEVLTTEHEQHARAVVAQSARQAIIHAVSAAAQEAGVRIGMPLAQAHALCPTLDVQARDRRREEARLAELATWAFRFTPTVSVEAPRSLLLEVQGSLHLFGGLSTLIEVIHQGLAAKGTQYQIAVAPTPQGSLLLARYGQTDPVLDCDALRAVLGRLPIAALPIDDKGIQRLTNTGVRDLHELFRLPREGLARRFGVEFVQGLDRMLGLAPDPRRTFVPPHRFEAQIELPAETADTNLILGGARQLLSRLAEFLQARDAAVDRLHVDLSQRRAATRITLGVRCGTRDVEQLSRLLSERLNQLCLSAPVLGVSLATEALQPFSAEPGKLFGHDVMARNGKTTTWHELFDRLEARLGAKTVHGVSPHADHRPEHAWMRHPSAALKIGRFGVNARPVWLLLQPQRLYVREGRPHRRGPLNLQGNAERIEGGWWDEKDVRRDYYLATDQQGSRLWVFRAHRSGKWYLHGLFA